MYLRIKNRLRSQSHHRLLTIVSVLMSALLVFTYVQAELADPRFQSGVLILEGWDIVLSPDGNYAAGRLRDVEKNLVEIRLWKLDTLHEKGVAMLEPTARVTLKYRVPSRVISSFEMRFSPDEQYLAVRKDYDLTVLTVPDFQSHAQVIVSDSPGVAPGALRWSQDGRFLATQGSGDLVVWDNQSDGLYRHELEEIWGPIIAVNDGWLLLRFMYGERPLTNAFSFCTKLAEDCTSYQMEQLLRPYYYGQAVVASPDGQNVLTFGQGNAGQIGAWAWRYDAGGNYVRSDTPLALGRDVVPLSFSPDGHYLITHGGEAIWDYETLTQLHMLDMAWDIIAFGPDNEYFVVLEFPSPLENMRIYRVGTETPLDTFSILELLDPAALDPGISEMEIAVDRDWVLVNIGQSGILVPIYYH